MFFDDLETKTGWCFYVQGGGPQVAHPNAPIKYMSYNVGYLEGKINFKKWGKEQGIWKEHWKPFSTFVHKLFRKSGHIPLYSPR